MSIVLSVFGLIGVAISIWLLAGSPILTAGAALTALIASLALIGIAELIKIARWAQKDAEYTARYFRRLEEARSRRDDP